MLNRSEREIEKSILAFLKSKNILCFKHDPQSAGRYKTSRGKGVADIILILPNGQFGAIEVKKEGGRLSDEQYKFIDKVNQLGGVAFVAKSILDVVREFNVRGIPL